MNLFTGESSDEYFGGELTPAARRMLDQLQSAPAAEFESLLWTAQVSSPECLPVYYLLYKYHASRRQFELAEKAVLMGLQQAASQAGLAADWKSVHDASHVDFSRTGPARFWLFTLKALAFISLRQGRADEASAALSKIRELHSGHGLGDDVIAALLEGSSGR